MATTTIVELRNEISEIINRAAYNSERTIITKHSKPVAVIVPVADAELLEALEDAVDIEMAREALLDDERVDWNDIKKELGL